MDNHSWQRGKEAGGKEGERDLLRAAYMLAIAVCDLGLGDSVGVTSWLTPLPAVSTRCTQTDKVLNNTVTQYSFLAVAAPVAAEGRPLYWGSVLGLTDVKS